MSRNDLSAFICCGLITYNSRLMRLWEEDPYYARSSTDASGQNGGDLVHEVFHHLGFKHPAPWEGNDYPGRGPAGETGRRRLFDLLSGMERDRGATVHLPVAVTWRMALSEEPVRRSRTYRHGGEAVASHDPFLGPE